jgi:ubiquinone/menaquinone biosynthesis C-methylase UbiE
MTERTPLNYDRIASTYHQRYETRKLEDVASTLHTLVERSSARWILEAGCGTGRWLEELQTKDLHIAGLDLSLGMLQKAVQRLPETWLVCGQASELPFNSATFDLVFCVNALHHFYDPHRFIREAFRTLRTGGALSVTGMDPHRGRDRWYIYDYFDETLPLDRQRFPSGGQLLDWMAIEGFQHIDCQVTEHIYHEMAGSEVLDDPFLQKNGTSQLAILTDEAYKTGMEHIQSKIARFGEKTRFLVDLELTTITGFA